MKNTFSTLFVVAAAGVLVFCAAASANHSATPALKVDELTKSLRAMESAASIDAAAAAYEKGCRVNRRSRKLQSAYMRKLLKLGRPDLALTPAQELLELDPNAPVALGTVAYADARKSRYLQSLQSAVKAARLDPTNKTICHNAAQLVAWYEADKRGAVKPETLRAMKDLPSDSRSFAAAYKRAKEGFKTLDVLKSEKSKIAVEAEKEAVAAEKEEAAEKNKLQDAEKAYSQQRRRLNDAQRELSRANRDVRRSSTSESRNSARRRIESIQKRVNSIRREMSKKHKEGKKIKEDWEKAHREAYAKRKAAIKCAREVKAVGAGMPAHFGWHPPAVDGVCTPDVTIAESDSAKPGKEPTGDGTSSYLVSGKSGSSPAGDGAKTPAPAASIEQRLAEAQAADKLQLARLCLDSDDPAMKTRARELLGEIVKSYPSTPSAGEARKLLGKMGK